MDSRRQGTTLDCGQKCVDWATCMLASYLGSAVTVVDRTSGKSVATVATAKQPVGIAIAPDGTKVYVACLGGREVDGDRNREPDAPAERPRGPRADQRRVRRHRNAGICHE